MIFNIWSWSLFEYCRLTVDMFVRFLCIFWQMQHLKRGSVFMLEVLEWDLPFSSALKLFLSNLFMQKPKQKYLSFINVAVNKVYKAKAAYMSNVPVSLICFTFTPFHAYRRMRNHTSKYLHRASKMCDYHVPVFFICWSLRLWIAYFNYRKLHSLYLKK